MDRRHENDSAITGEGPDGIVWCSKPYADEAAAFTTIEHDRVCYPFQRYLIRTSLHSFLEDGWNNLSEKNEENEENELDISEHRIVELRWLSCFMATVKCADCVHLPPPCKRGKGRTHVRICNAMRLPITIFESPIFEYEPNYFGSQVQEMATFQVIVFCNI